MLFHILAVITNLAIVHVVKLTSALLRHILIASSLMITIVLYGPFKQKYLLYRGFHRLSLLVLALLLFWNTSGNLVFGATISKRNIICSHAARLTHIYLAGGGMIFLIPPNQSKNLNEIDFNMIQAHKLNVKYLRIIAMLLKHNKIKTLNLNWTYLGDAGIKIISTGLKDNASLQKLNLKNNNITNKGILYLTVGLNNNHTLKTLYLDGNQIGDVGAKVLAKLLKHNKTLIELTLKNNPIGTTGMSVLANGIKQSAIEKLSIMPNQWQNYTRNHVQTKVGPPIELNKILKILKSDATLKSLDISEIKANISNAESIGNYLAGNKTLTEIIIDHSGFRYFNFMPILVGLEKNNTLDSIALQGNLLSNESGRLLAKVFEKNVKLTHINLANNSLHRSAILAFAKLIRKNPKLIVLNLWGNPSFSGFSIDIAKQFVNDLHEVQTKANIYMGNFINIPRNKIFYYAAQMREIQFDKQTGLYKVVRARNLRNKK